MNFILIYITNPTKAEAKKIAKYLISKKLIACANIFPINSIYKWQGKIQDEKEFVLVAKTKADKYNAIKKQVKKIHSYNTPCIIRISVSSNKKYFDWLNKQIKK